LRHRLGEEPLLGAEVADDQRGVDPHHGCHVAHAHVVVAVAGEQDPGGLEHRRPRRRRPAPPTRSARRVSLRILRHRNPPVVSAGGVRICAWVDSTSFINRR
jgi:hypothetical protein